MPEQFESHYFSGKGALFLGDLDANSEPTNLIFIGDMGQADLTPEVDRTEVIENVSGGNAVGAAWTRSIKYQFSASMRSVKPAHLALALQSSNTAKAGASVTDESHVGHHDAFIALQHTKISAVTVTSDPAGTTFTENTDYVVHADEGMIEVLSTGTITDAQALLVDYTYAAQHHLNANPTLLNKCLVFAGKNIANSSKQTRCTIYQIQLDPSVLTFLSDEAAEMPLSGTIETVGTRTVGDQLYSWKMED